MQLSRNGYAQANCQFIACFRYTLRQGAIDEKRQSYVNCVENGFAVGPYEEMLPDADVVLNLTPDKQHTAVVNAVM